MYTLKIGKHLNPNYVRMTRKEVAAELSMYAESMIKDGKAKIVPIRIVEVKP